ncbi:MAG TPA: serine hydrolase [Roseomonas sp.]|jgi:beta-lactamase class A
MMQALADRMNAICDAQPFRTSWFLKDLTTGAEAHRDGHVQVPSASVRKISILMAALKAVHEGRIDLMAPVTVEARHQKDVASGTYRYMTPGCVIPFRDALVNMIITSDNVCTQLVLEHLGDGVMDAYCAAIGMTRTRHRGLIPPLGLAWDHPVDATAATTPADQVLLLDLILRGTTDAATAATLGSSTALCALALDILSWQVLRNLMPSQLPYGTKVANKTGRGRRGRMDAGIVFRDGKPIFIIAAMTDFVPETMPDGMPGYVASFATIGGITRAAWDSIG